MPIRRPDLLWFSHTVEALYAASSRPELGHVIVNSTTAHYRAIGCTIEELERHAQQYTLHALRCEIPPPPDHEAYVHDNPLDPLWNRGAAVLTLSNTVDRRTWERTDHFNAIARPMGINDQALCVLERGSRLLGFSVFRDRILREDDVHLLRLLTVHLRAAWRSLPPSAPDSRRTQAWELRVDPSGRLLAPPGSAEAMLRVYFPNWRVGGVLPPALCTWVQDSLSALRRNPPLDPLYLFRIESARGRLVVRCFPPMGGGSIRIRCTEKPHQPDYLRLKAFGLTTRECEILHWVAEGKRDSEIAAILGCSARTVGKHVEHVLVKVRGENRTAAVSAALDLLAGPLG